MDAKRKESMSIMKKIMIAMVTGILLGVVCLWLRESLTAGGNEGTWKLINRIFFQDITQEKGFYSLGLFYIIQQLFMRGLQLAIVPLVLSSLSLALCSMADPKRLGKIAGKTIGTFVGFYVCGATLAGLFAYFIKSMGWFSVNLPETTTSNVATLEAYNPLTTVINAVPSNVVEVLGSNNSILAVVVVAVILGLSMNALGDKAATIKSLLQNLNDIVQVYMDFLINKVSPIAIFCMLARTFATYGTEYIRPTLTFMIATIFISLALVVTIYPIGIFLLTGLNPFKFAKKIFKVGMFATAAGINITPTQLITAAFLSICVAMGTPAIPVAGTTLIFVIMSGLGLSSDLCMVAYALVLAISYLPGMAVITLNVVGDAATTVIVSYKENELDKDVYNS